MKVTEGQASFHGCFAPGKEHGIHWI